MGSRTVFARLLCGLQVQKIVEDGKFESKDFEKDGDKEPKEKEEPGFIYRKEGKQIVKFAIEKYEQVVYEIGNNVLNSENNKYSLLETNIDDMSPEIIGYVQERLFDIGVLDVWTTPIYMKKNRPAIKISCILPNDLEKKVANVLLEETSTFGVRSRDVLRYEADRKIKKIDTRLGAINVKFKIIGGKVFGAYPEYEDCRRIAIDKSIPLQNVMELAQAQANDLLD